MPPIKTLFLILFFSSSTTVASESPNDIAQQLAEHYLNTTPPSVPALTPEAATKVQMRFVERLKPTLGHAIGYKVGLTSQPAQQRFGVNSPIAGVLLQEMLLPSGSTIESGSGIRLMAEADLLVRVKSTNINQATTHQEILAALSEAIPYIEVPDLVYQAGQKLDGPALTAINAGARFGILGKPIFLSSDENWIERLANFQVELRDKEGQPLANGKGAAILGHPLNVVRWMRDYLSNQGKSLQPGDLISLGAITKLIKARPGARFQAEYTGLDPHGPQIVEVSFTEN